MRAPRGLLGLIGMAVWGLMWTSPALADSEAAGIAVAPIGHWHVFNEKTLTFDVTDKQGAGLGGLNLVVEIAREGSDRITVRSVADDQIVDEGGGTYTLAYTPSSIGSYAMHAKTVDEDHAAVSMPIVFEVARDGDEGVKVTANGVDYVYQVRYNWDPGHIHANQDEPAKLVFELMRGVETGSDINWDRPWTNTFDHVTGAKDVAIRVVAEDGSVTEELSAVYRGRGIYEAGRIFAPDEVGHEKLYEVAVSFVDPANDAMISNPEAYALRAVASH